jgi:hypothetical protein
VVLGCLQSPSGSFSPAQVPKVDGKFRYIERVALVQINMERIFLFTYFPSRECEFPVTNEIFTQK